MTIESVANAIKEISQMFNCSFETAWKQYTHPAIREKYTYEEVIKHIEGEEEEAK